MRKLQVALAGLIIIGGSVAVATSVAAHATVAVPSCGGLSWNAHDYSPTDTNSIVVRVDSAPVHSVGSFGAADAGSVVFSKSADHVWSVVVDAPGAQFDYNLGGSIKACETPPTTTVAPTTTTTPPTTTVAATTTTLAPTTTIADGTTTTVADVATTTATPTTRPRRAAGAPQLPGTGRNVDPILAVAFMFTFGGFCLYRMRSPR